MLTRLGILYVSFPFVNFGEQNMWSNEPIDLANEVAEERIVL